MLLKLSQANHIFLSLKARSTVLFMMLKLITAYHSASEKKKLRKVSLVISSLMPR